MEKLPLEWSKLLYLRFTSLYGERFTKSHSSDQLVQMWWEDWADGLSGIAPDCIKDALNHCKLNVDWPPSLSEFRKICEKFSGYPSADDAFYLAIRRDFNHPITKLAYDKVGSWAMKNDKQSELKPKFTAAYQDALNYFRQNQQQAWLQLEEFHAQPPQLEAPPKIPTNEEIIGWRERLARYQEMAKADKAKLESKDHPQWDKQKITRGSRNYDEAYYNERKRYLLGVDEIMAGTLPREDWYDRTRYMREIEAAERVKQFRADNPQPEEKMPPRAYNQARNVYKSWSD